MSEQKTITKRASWLTKEKRPIVIAGPCSAETEEQVIETAVRLKKTGKSDIYRAGIWKPRTSPGSFEGVGTKGLPWLQKVKEITGFPTTVEVAKASHVELCLEFGIDILWIGARTTVNPFAVQEIADALRGVDIPVLVKNPINPDLALWNGSVQRIRKAGVKEVGAIHRGFSNLGEKYYRNRPQWQIAIEFMRQNPDLPMICDPSHICGRRDILQDVGQKAMDLDFDGLMIESHIDPDNAWSDAKQQIKPEVLDQMTVDLRIRKEEGDAIEFQNKLATARTKIDVVDHQLIEMLGKRMKISDKIGALKKQNNVAILQTKRWNEILGKMILQGEEQNLSEEFILKVFKAIHQESINHQKKVINK